MLLSHLQFGLFDLDQDKNDILKPFDDEQTETDWKRAVFVL